MSESGSVVVDVEFLAILWCFAAYGDLQGSAWPRIRDVAYGLNSNTRAYYRYVAIYDKVLGAR